VKLLAEQDESKSDVWIPSTQENNPGLNITSGSLQLQIRLWKRLQTPSLHWKPIKTTIPQLFSTSFTSYCASLRSLGWTTEAAQYKHSPSTSSKNREEHTQKHSKPSQSRSVTSFLLLHFQTCNGEGRHWDNYCYKSKVTASLWTERSQQNHCLLL